MTETTTGGATTPGSEHSGGPPEYVASALKTHRYLRLSLVFAVVALLIGVTIASLAGGYVKGSISYYYWTPARNVFVGVLIAASLAMLVLNGRGGAAAFRLLGWKITLPSPSTLLDLAAVFGPLIAIVPTDMKKIEQGLTTFTCDVGEVECLPKAALPDVQNGVLTYMIIVTVAVVVMWLIRDKKSAREPFARLVPVTALVTAAAMGVLTFWLNGTFPYIRIGDWSISIHYIATFLFFASFAAVVFIRGFRDADPEDQHKATPLQKRWYMWLAGLMALDMAFLVSLSFFAWFGVQDLLPGVPEVLLGEAFGLILFAVFWGIQTNQRWDEVITTVAPGRPAAAQPEAQLTPAGGVTI
ncbi:hypothetical protein [Microbacterium sp. SS28]|uniref:hypothetical protein n=1 Tax=Microbacterium sp. SS28 TaxID=2919948 RepID=UPI001FAA68C5|nr:hypothetical protein [Microbacterium sp. SS28]